MSGRPSRNPDNVQIRKQIEAQNLHLGVLRHGSQVPSIVVPQPIRVTARETEMWPPKLVEASTDLVEGRARVGRPSPDLIKSVDKERLVAPFGMAVHVQGKKVAGGDQADIFLKRLAFGLKRGRLAGAGVAEQYIG